MSTNSRIFYKDGRGIFRGISCYYDGSLNGVGAMLFQHYQYHKKVMDLISLGDIISLDKECEVGPTYQSISLDNKESKQFGYTLASHRDLKQPYVKPTVKNNLSDLEKYYHVYVWSDNKWYSYNAEQSQWKILKEELIELYKERSAKYLYMPKTVEIEYEYEDYMKNIRREFLLIDKEKNQFTQNDYIKIKANKEGKYYELLVKVIETIESEEIKEGYQLILLSKPSEDIAWYCPVIYEK